LHQAYLNAPEAQAGQIPIVKVTGTTVTEAKTPQGTSRFHSPIFEIAKWMHRSPELGEATASPGVVQQPVSAPAGEAKTVRAEMPTNHVPPPAPKPAPVKADLDDDLPF